MRAILAASSRVFSPASAASASWVAAPEAEKALSMRRCGEKIDRKRNARNRVAFSSDARAMRAPFRKKPRALPAGAL